MPKPYQKMAILGGAGGIGRALVNRALVEGWDVVVLDLAASLESYAELLKNNYREAEAEHMLACARAIIDHNLEKESLQGIT